MRMIVINQNTDLKALGARLFGIDSARESALAGLQRLNPHVNFDRMEPGTVILVPEQAGLRDGESVSVSGTAFEAFAVQARSAVEGIAAHVRSGHENRLAQQKDFAALLKSPALKRLFESDPDLKKEFDAAQQTFKDDQQAAKESDSLLKALQEQSALELAGLGKLLG